MAPFGGSKKTLRIDIDADTHRAARARGGRAGWRTASSGGAAPRGRRVRAPLREAKGRRIPEAATVPAARVRAPTQVGAGQSWEEVSVGLQQLCAKEKGTGDIYCSGTSEVVYSPGTLEKITFP